MLFKVLAMVFLILFFSLTAANLAFAECPPGQVELAGEGCVGTINYPPAGGTVSPTAPASPVKTFPDFISKAETPGQLVSGFYIYALGIVGVIAFGAVVYGAVLWVVSAGMPSKKAEAKSWIMGAIFGIALLLGAYVIFNTINPKITRIGEIDAEIKAGLTEIPTPEASQVPLLPGVVGGDLTGLPWPPTTFSVSSDANIRGELNAAGVTINNGNCAFIGQTNCTSLAGLPQSTVDYIKNVCGGGKCQVTGGTEYWLHGNKSANMSSNGTEHGLGNPVVDISYNPSVLAKIESMKSSGDIQFYQCEINGDPVSCNGNQAPDHIHIKFKK